MKGFMLILFATVLTHVIAESENKEQILRRLQNLEQIVQEERVINTQQQLTIDRQNTVIQNLESEIDRLNGKVKENSSAQKRQTFATTDVAFSTRLTQHLRGLGHHAAVIFDKVVLDTTTSYNHGNGVFIPPITGIYVFTWTVSVNDGRWESTELVVDGTPYGYSLVDSESDADNGSGSQTVVLKVTKGQHVWIRTGTIGGGTLDGNHYDTFSGWLLYSLE